MPEKRSLGQAHAFGNGCRGDTIWILLGGQFYNNFNSCRSSFVCRKMFDGCVDISSLHNSN
jgi:hypothetical protein